LNKKLNLPVRVSIDKKDENKELELNAFNLVEKFDTSIVVIETNNNIVGLGLLIICNIYPILDYIMRS